MKKNNLIFILVVLLLIVISIYSGYKIYDKYKMKFEAKKINPIIKVNSDTYNTIAKTKKEYNNEDIIGILNIASMDVIIVQGNDNKFYLNHLLNKEENPAGSIFLDYREDINTSKQLNIFGHSSNYYDLPFNKLMDYLNYDFYQDNKYVSLKTEDHIYKYEIFSVYETEEEEHLRVSFNSTEDYINHLNILKQNSLYETGINVEESDKILIIQTCIINDPKSLLIINLRKVEGE